MNRRKYYEGIAKGLCSRCGIREKVPGYCQCQKCIEYRREYDLRRLRKLSEKGICHHCKRRPAKKGLVGCEECLKKDSEQHIRRSKKRAENGLCALCGAPSGGFWRCVVCEDLKRKGAIVNGGLH